MTISDDLAVTLAMISQAASTARDDWWIIGSAAVALCGGAVPLLKDVDLMMSTRDADHFIRCVGGARIAPEASERFRSDIFGIWAAPPIPVEIFGGFHLSQADGWRRVHFATRRSVTVPGGRIYIPAVIELRRLLHSFGRAKDIERLGLLNA